MKRWKYCLAVFVVFLFTVLGMQTVLAYETGTCGDNLSVRLVDLISKFTIGVDNNSYTHSNKAPESGFYNYNTYYMTGKDFNDLLSEASSIGEKTELLHECIKEWEGSCFGIANTMCLVQRGIYTAAQISSRGAPNYYQIGKPCNDVKFLSIINYYQLSQFLDRYDDNVIYSMTCYPNSNNLNSFLYGMKKRACDARDYGSTSVFSYGYYKKNEENKLVEHGHSILIVGLSDDGNTIKLYDENGFKSINMVVDEQNGMFEFVDGNSNIINENTYSYMMFGEPVRSSTLEGSLRVASNYSSISFSSSSSFILTTQSGKYLQYDNGVISGSLNVLDVTHIAKDKETQIIVKTDHFDVSEVQNLSDQLDISISDNGIYRAVEGSSIDKVNIDKNGAIQLSGTNYSFRAFLNVNEVPSDCMVAAGSLSAFANGDVNIITKGDTIEAKSTNVLDNIEVGIYKDTSANKKRLPNNNIISINVSSGSAGSSGGSQPSTGDQSGSGSQPSTGDQSGSGSQPSTEDQLSGRNHPTIPTSPEGTQKFVVEQEKITIAKTPSSIKAKAKKNKVTVTWKKIKKTKKTKKLLAQINGIQIQYSTDPKFEQNPVMKMVGKTKKKIVLKLERKTIYYVRVRYVGSDGVSNWSKVKKVKTKK